MATYTEELILNNINLAYDLAWKYNRKLNNAIEFEELKSVALLGLTKAANTFNKQLGYTFSTYAYRTIVNDILMYINANIKYFHDESIFENVADGVEFIETLSDNKDILDIVFRNIDCQLLYAKINELPNRYKKVLLYKLKGYTTDKIGKLLHYSQPQVSLDYYKAINMLRNKFNVDKEE